MGATQVKPIPDGYHSVTPYLTFEDAAAAIDWCKRALGAEELCRVAVTIACVGRDGRPVRLPAPLRQALSHTLPEQK